MSVPIREIKVTFDEESRFAAGRRMPHLHFVSNQIVTVDLLIEQLVTSACPPAPNPVDIVGWTGRWLGKLDANDFEVPLKFDIAGVITGPSTDGRMRFLIPKLTMDFEIERGYSEFTLSSIGGDPDIKVPVIYTATRAALII